MIFWLVFLINSYLYRYVLVFFARFLDWKLIFVGLGIVWYRLFVFLLVFVIFVSRS